MLYSSPINLKGASSDQFIGYVLSGGQAVPDVDITVQQKTCHSLSLQTHPSGKYSFSLPYSIDYSAVPFTLQYSKPGYYNVTSTQHTGGIPLFWSPKTIDVELVPVSQLQSTLRVSTISTSRNHLISNVTVELRTGLNNFTGPIEYSRLSKSGVAWFEYLPAGVYSIAASAEGYFRSHRDVAILGGRHVNESVVLSPTDLTDQQIRVTLSWSSDADLDLRTQFILNENLTCDVGFDTRLCAGSKLSSESSSGSGGEAITLREVGPFQYLFYVQDYSGSKRMSKSASAELSVYTTASFSPVFRLKIPRNSESQDGNVWAGFCLNGIDGVATIYPLQQILNYQISADVCTQVYGPRHPVVLGKGATTLQRNSTAVPLPAVFTHWFPISNLT